MPKRKVKAENLAPAVTAELKHAAVMMGYRMMQNGGYAKPFGWSVLTICPVRGLLEQWFWDYSTGTELLLWWSERIKPDQPLLPQIKEFEAGYVKGNLQAPINYDTDRHHFEFASMVELIGHDILGV